MKIKRKWNARMPVAGGANANTRQAEERNVSFSERGTRWIKFPDLPVEKGREEP
jgi:hypothetical protein